MAARKPSKETAKEPTESSAPSGAKPAKAPKTARANAKKKPAEAPAPETHVDEKLVKEAEEWLRRTIAATMHRGLLEVGEYLFDKFYDRDIERVRQNNPRKHVSFRALVERCDTVHLPVSRGTLYNAVSVAVMGHSLPDPAAYRQLPSSHQAALLPLKDPVKVDRLAQRTKEKSLTVRELKEIVAAEVAVAAPSEGPVRGRPKLPVVLKAMRRVVAELSGEGERIGFTKAQVEELEGKERTEVLKLVERVVGEMERVRERLGEG